MLITVVFYTLTGLISGAAVVLAYNFVGRFLPLLRAEIEPEPGNVPEESLIDPVPAT